MTTLTNHEKLMLRRHLDSAMSRYVRILHDGTEDGTVTMTSERRREIAEALIDARVMKLRLT